MDSFFVKGDFIGGAFKKVHKAIDRRKGIEVAWNELDLNNYMEFDKILQEVRLLSEMDNKHIIHFFESWMDKSCTKLVFITELMTSGTLRSFVQQGKFFSLRAVKDWCRQILEGLNYLHTRTPPIIHRDIKLDNIFFHGAKGKVKIGGLGLATFQKMNQPMSTIGTPEYMAPECYEGQYDQKVDIWAFGLCVIEIVTLEYPFKECSNNYAFLYRTVSSGLKPQALAKILDPTIVEFVSLCLNTADTRLSAGQLLEHPFLKDHPQDQEYIKLRNESELDEVFRIIGSPPTKLGWETWLRMVTNQLQPYQTPL